MNYKSSRKISFNDISPIIQYKLDKGVTALWMGDLTTDFMEKIENEVNWEKVDILFAPTILEKVEEYRVIS